MRRLTRAAAVLAAVGVLAPLTVAGPRAAAGPQVVAAPASDGASRLVPLAPTRVVDTRTGLGVAAPGRLRADTSVALALAGRAGIPDNGASAVVLNVTMTDTAASGYVTLWPHGVERPLVSNVNAATADATVANLAVVALGADGRLDLYALQAAHVVIDVAGYFVPAPAAVAGGRFRPLTPARLLDTRTGNGAPARRPAAASTTRLVVAGRSGVPPAGASAVAVSVTATDTTGAGYVTVWPGDGPRPLASNLNVPGPDATVANAVVVPLGADGTLALFTQRSADLVVDVVGWFTGDAAAPGRDGLFVPLGPRRALDTRGGGDRLDARFRRDVGFDLTTDAAGVVANLTVTASAAALYLTAYPAGTARPLASNVNVDGPGTTRANLAIMPLSAGNRASFYASAATDLVVDVAGWFTGSPLATDPAVAPTAPGPQGAPPLPGFDDEIRAFLAAKDATGATVAVSRNGRLVYARAYGAADAAAGEAMRIDGRLRFASLSKPLAATAAMRLAEQGRLSLDTPVWPLIDDVIPRPAGADARTASITVRNLLSHTSGFLAWMDPFFNDTADVVSGLGPTGATSCPQGAAWFLTWPLAYAPGTDVAYTNIDYCLLGAVLEAVTGEAWQDVVTTQVLQPAGLLSERVGRTRNDRHEREAVHVTPAVDEPGGGLFMEGLAAAGAWLGTSVDLVRFVDALTAGALVRPATLATMLADPGAKPAATAWWGLGLRSYDGRGPAGTWGHTGSLHNARGMLLHQADGTSWAILVNGTFPDHGTQLAALMTRALAAVPVWPTGDLSGDLP